MADTEKITINLTVVDLGKMDILVDEGFYTNRTDFIRAAIRNELQQHRQQLEQITIAKSYVMGVMQLDAAGLQESIEKGEMLAVRVIGMLVLSDDITPDLAEQALSSVKVWGKLFARDDVREHLQGLGRLPKNKMQ
jgi:Arc/MetJ-type ribon-helix-helix transcriptional regulator